MRKYWLTYTGGIQEGLVYRFNSVSMIFAEGISMTVIFYLWFSISRSGNTIGGYSFKSIIIYFIFTKFISIIITSTDTGRTVGDYIRNGFLNQYLVKPINFMFEIFCYNLGQATFSLFINLFLFLLVFSFIGFNSLNLSVLSVLVFFIFLLLGMAINYFTFFIVGAMTFYMDFVMGLNFTVYMIVLFVSGGILPLNLISGKIFYFLNLLPFKFIYFVPISYISGKYSVTFYDFAYAILWAVILYLLAKKIYNNGLKKYETFGG
jgi:ABC-2 type transport system permease protein